MKSISRIYLEYIKSILNKETDIKETEITGYRICPLGNKPFQYTLIPPPLPRGPYQTTTSPSSYLLPSGPYQTTTSPPPYLLPSDPYQTTTSPLSSS